MAFNKRTWLGRQGTGLNKFSIGGASPVTIVNQPDSVTQVGDALSAGNLNDLEDRIEDAFDDVDTALDTKADEQDVTNLNDALTAIDHRVSNLEQAKGDYIVSAYKDGSITPSGKGKWCVVEGVEGVSRVENNIARGAYSRVVAGLAITYDSTTNRITITGTANATGDYTFFSQAQSDYVAGHKYLALTNCKTSLRLTANGTYSDFNNSTLFTFSSGTVFFGINAVNGTTYNEDFYICIKDLNVYFGGTIPSDADTIAEIQTNYPHLLTPSEYGTRIVDSSYTGVRAWSRNIFDKSVAVANERWNGSVTSASSGTTRSVLMRVKPSTTYYFKNVRSSSVMTSIYWFDINQNYISSDGIGGAEPVSGTKTSPANACYVGINLPSSALDTCCVNISDSNDGTTTPYMENTLSLSFQGKSAGSVRDTLELNVEVEGVARKRTTQRISVSYDLSTLSWSASSSVSGAYYATFDVGYKFTDDVSAMCDKLLYIGTMSGTGGLDGRDKVFALYYSPNSSFREIYIRDTSLSSASQISGYVQFEMAEEVVTLSDPIIDNTLLTESGGRMSTVQTGTVVDGSFDMGFITL